MTDQIQSIPIANIVTPVRIRPVDNAHVARLAESIKTRGLDQPVIVHERDGGFALGPGRHRLEALIKLGETTVTAIVRGPATDEELLAEQVSENLQRKDLTALEEANLCASTLAQCGEDERRASELMGKPLRWVQNRAALARLPKAVRDLVAANRLPLSHAQAIARVPSTERQIEIAEISAADEPGENPSPLSNVLDWVEAEGRQLSDVNWRMDVPFGEANRACVTCPFNSANRGDLFAEGAEPKKPTCLERVCYQDKTALAARGAQKAANFIVKQGLKVSPASAKEAVAAREVAFVDPSVVKDYIRSAPAPAKKGKGGKAKAAQPEQPKGPNAQELLNSELREWKHAARDVVGKATEKKPFTCALIDLVGNTTAVPDWNGTKPDSRVVAAVKPLLAKANNVTGDMLLAAAKLIPSQDGAEISYHMPDELLETLATALSVKLPVKPTLESVKAQLAKKAEANRAAKGAAPAAGKKKAKRK